MNIERPVANASTKSSSLYQQTMSTIEQLYSIPGFEFYLFPEGVANLMKNNDGNPMIDPVAVLWGCFRLGAPLCHLINCFKLKKLDVPDVSGLTTYNNTCKKSIYFFLLACKEDLKITDDSLFTITELYRDDTNGFVKVLSTVNKVLEELQKRGLSPPRRRLPFLDTKIKESPMDNRSKVIQELLLTERKYINDLQVLQEYENELRRNSSVSRDLVVGIFGNLGELLDFQRRLLIAMEATLALPFEEQRIGALFVSNEEAFSVYVPFCGNYESAIELARSESEFLQKLGGSMDPIVALPSHLIKPVQRICKYPLLLNEIIKLSTAKTYPHLDELKRGLDVVKRVADRVNEMTRKNENHQLKENLRSWVSDWKYFDLDGSGELLLSDRFLMSTPDGDKEYHVFLFEKVLLCCKDQKKKKRFSSKDDQPSYALRGNIFMSSVIEVVNSSKPAEQSFNLRIYWKDVADMESFSLKCKNEEQVLLWKQRLEKVIAEEKNRKRRTYEDKSMHGAHLGGSTSNLRYSVESNRSWEDADKNSDRYSALSTRSYHSPDSTRQSMGRRERASSLNHSDRSSSSVIRPNRAQTFGQEQIIDSSEINLSRNSDSVRYSPLSPTAPPQSGLPLPGMYTSGRSSTENFSRSSISRKSPSVESIGRLSLHDESRITGMSIRSPVLPPSRGSVSSALIKVKVFYGSDIFVIALAGICSYAELLSKIERKIQLAGTNLPENQSLKLRYKDEDGDFIQIFGDDDLFLAFDVCRHLGDSDRGIMHLFVE